MNESAIVQEHIILPITPNRPCSSPDEDEKFGEVLLRTHITIGLTENSLFSEDLAHYDRTYQNNQSISLHFLAHMHAVSSIIQRHCLFNAHVIEVGCGKGDFIQLLEEQGYSSITGFDATYEGSKPTIFNRYLSKHDQINADFIIARHMLDYLPRPHDYLRMLREINTNRSSLIYIEVPCFDWIKTHNAFFDITYERVNYFTSTALAALFDGNVLESGTLFGGQYIYVVARLKHLSESFSVEYDDAEKWRIEPYTSIFPKVYQSIFNCQEKLTGGRRGFVWGASTKGCLFLYHYKNEVGSTASIPFVVDINPEKVGKFLPGTKIPIRSTADLFKEAKAVDLLIVPNPNYVDEIRQELVAHGLGEMEILCL